MCQNLYLKKCFNIEDKGKLIPTFRDHKESSYNIPELKITENNKRKANDDIDTLAHKMRKLNEDFGDNGIYWCVDNERFDKYLRDQMIVNYYENRIDKVKF